MAFFHLIKFSGGEKYYCKHVTVTVWFAAEVMPFVYLNKTMPFQCHSIQRHINRGKRETQLIKDTTKLGTQWEPRSDAKQRAEVRAQDKWSRVRADEKNKWSVSAEVLRRGRRQGNPQMQTPTPCHDQSAHWMIYVLSQILSPLKEKLHPIELLMALFWKDNVIWGCGCVKRVEGRLAIRCGNRATWKCLHLSSVQFIIIFDECSICFYKYQNFNDDTDRNMMWTCKTNSH